MFFKTDPDHPGPDRDSSLTFYFWLKLSLLEEARGPVAQLLWTVRSPDDGGGESHDA